jgi:photosystem II stability/assembly factor-like uncharacterized protein
MRTWHYVAALTCAAFPLCAQDRWLSLGPAPITSGPYTGRVAAVACSVTNANRYYVGGADGGVWRSDNGGASWLALGDALPSAAIGALALEPGNDAVVYAGMGEANYANHSRYGFGIARSRDAGATWEILGASVFSGRCISRIRIPANNTNVLYVGVTPAGGFPARAAAREHPQRNGPFGLFKSSDGGASWQHLTNNLPARDCTDVALDPSNASVVYAAIGDIFGHASNGIYKSIDAGMSWVKLAGGLPATVGRICLSVAPTQAARVYAAYINPSDASGGGASTLGVFRSDNGGTSWTSLSTVGSTHATYGWYLCTSGVSPTDPNAVLIGGLTLRRSTNAGSTWATVTPPHVDLHALEFDANNRLLCGGDGGLHRSSDLGASWQSLNNNLSLVQFYAGLSVHPYNADDIIGGTQDNGTNRRTSGTNWTSVLGGDGGYTGIDPTGTRVYAESQGTGALYRSVSGGGFSSIGAGLSGRNCFLPPYEIHPSNPLLMIYGTERVFRSADGGTSWTAISPDLTGGGIAAIRALAFAPSDPNTMYVATNDGRVQVTRNGGGNWTLVLTGLSGWPRTMRSVRVHPNDPARAFVVASAFGVVQVRGTRNAGATWQDLDGDLPDVPANTIAVDASQGDPVVLYVGTDRGVFRSTSEGRWETYAPGLPNSPVIDLILDHRNSRVLAATQGRGLWRMRLLPRDQRATMEPR